MAIYKTGQASVSADGVVTGYGTKWKDALSLIRKGCTIAFATSPTTFATISDIRTDTEMTLTDAPGVEIPRGDYVILLTTSITVDGLAQDVAETLRYYQGRETQYEQFVEFLENFDWKKFETVTQDVKANADAAQASANAAKTSETKAASSASAAKTSETNAANIAASIGNAERNAAASAAAAKTSETNAAASASAASGSASAAKTSETNAKTSETNAASSATAANNSKTAAATSATNAAGSATSASNSASAAKTSETNAASSASSAKTSETNAAASASAAAGSATTAKNEADRAKSLADSLDTSKLMMKGNNLSDVANVSQARANLGLGDASNVTFNSVTTSGDINAIRTSDAPTRSPAITSRIVGSDGTVLAQAELWADTNSNSIALVNRNPTGPRFFSINSDGSVNPSGRILSNYGAEYTWNGEALTLQPLGASQSTFMLIRDYDRSNVFLVGRHGASYDTILNNYKYNTNLTFGSVSIDANRTINAPTIESRSGYVNSIASSNSANCHFYFMNADRKNRGVIYSNDNQVINIRPDNVGTGASGSGLSVNGANGVCTAVQFSSTSDERAKFWIKPVTDALDKVCSLKGVTYSMHTTTQNTVRNAGLIAQDVQKVLPEAVHVGEVGKTLDKNCFEVEDPLSLDYSAMSALYVEAFKEVRSEMQAMRDEIKSLKAEIELLKNPQ